MYLDKLFTMMYNVNTVNIEVNHDHSQRTNPQ